MVEDKTFQLLVATLGVVCAVFAVRKWTRTSGGIPGQFIRFGMSVSQSFIYLNSRIIIIIKTKNIRIQETLLFKRKSNILLMYIGPTGWPVVGYMPYMAPNSIYTTMKYLIEKYGPIFKLRLGSVDTVVITDYQLIKKAFRSHELSYRPNLFFFEFASQGFHGF